MITKQDCLTILVKLSDEGIHGADAQLGKLLASREPTLDTLKFISENRGLEVSNFYEVLRKSYNKKKSNLYINIVKEAIEENDVIITLSCLLTQILLYGKKITEKDTFYKAVRAEEITRVLNAYFTDGEVQECIKLLRLVKADLCVLEYIAGKRELE